MTLSYDDICQARKNIGSVISNTAIEISRNCSKLLNTNVYLKYENQQITGSFKVRGALNKMHFLSQDKKAKQVVAASAGNHAQGVAYSATYKGFKSHIVMPLTASLVKMEAARQYGAQVILYGDIFDEAYTHARELEKQKGYIFVHPFEDKHVMAGQGTIGLEILENLPDMTSVIVPVGGGGLISGIATAIKAQKPQCKVYGAVASRTPGMKVLFDKQKFFYSPSFDSIADGIAIKNPSQFMYDNYISRLVDDIVSVSEDEIARAMVFLLERAKTVVEGSGAVGLAAAEKVCWNLGDKCCVLLSGGNVDMNLIAKVIDRGLVAYGRIAHLNVVMDDSPGTLHFLTKEISTQGANILEVHHDRLSPQVGLRETRISFLLEIKSQEHLIDLKKKLNELGVRIV